MKKVKYGVLLLVLIGIVFVGCQKDNPQPNRSQIAKVNKPFHSDNINLEKAETNHLTKKYSEWGGLEKLAGCWKNPHPNCYDPVVIKPSTSKLINKIEDATRNNNTDKLIEIIEANYNTFLKYIPSEDLDSIISKRASVRINDLSDTKGICYFIISKNKKIYHVFQFKK